MNEKQTKTLTLLVKIAGYATTLAGYSAMIPEKFAVVGLIVVATGSVLKDLIARLGDFWDDGKMNNSFKGLDQPPK